MLDLELRVSRWPELGETMAGQDLLVAGGGKAANVALAARRLGAPVELVGRVGGDELAGKALAGLRQAGVDLLGVQVDAAERTGVTMIAVDPDGQETMLVATHANERWPEDEVRAVEGRLASAPAGSVLVANPALPPSALVRAARAARAAGLTVVVDPSPPDRFPAELYPLVHALTPNPDEAERLTGAPAKTGHQAAQAGRLLLRRGADSAFMKLGDGGCVVVRGDTVEELPAPPGRAVDKTGAGDAFAGALAVALLEGRSAREGGRMAVAAAAIAVRSYGAQTGYPTRDQLTAFMAAAGS